MLQSEYDVIVRHKRLKVLLIILTALAAGVVVYAVVKVGKEEMPVSLPVVVKPVADEKPLPVSREEGMDQSGIIKATPGENYNPTGKVESVQQPVSAGTSSAEAERDRLREIGSKIPVPPPPPGVK